MGRAAVVTSGPGTTGDSSGAPFRSGVRGRRTRWLVRLSNRYDGSVPTMDDAEIAAQLRLSATRLHRRLRQEAGSGLSPSQGSALAAIGKLGPLTLGALAEHER